MDSQQTDKIHANDIDRDVLPEIPVLIIGGGPVGLTTSILLSYHGVRSLLVEQHPGTSIYPKARFINARTMEIFRQLGIEQAIREVAIPCTDSVVIRHSLVGAEIARRPVETMIPQSVRVWSPTWGCVSTQEIFEPILLAQARLGESARIRFNTQFLTFEQHDEHIVARLLDRPTGRVWDVRAQYLVGADGPRSRVREILGIRMQGEPVLRHYINILFRADLNSLVADRQIGGGFITNPEAAGMLVYNGGNRWRFQISYEPDRGERPEDYAAERCLQLIRAAVGVADVSLELDGIFPWSDAALVAERFGDRRAFLVGDAEHLMSPAGGFGMNVGLQNAHNLAWKLAAVLKGWTGPLLPATYETERAPISRQITDRVLRTITSARGTSREAVASSPSAPGTRPQLPPDLFREHGSVFGATYSSSVIVPDGTAPAPVTNPVTDYVPTARPGSRAPHLWLERGDRRVSTLDLYGRHFVLLTGQEGQDWCRAAEHVAARLRVPLQAIRIGPTGEWQDSDRVWAATYGVEESGAVLVRPDGYVAWRSLRLSGDSESELGATFATALGRRLHYAQAGGGDRRP